MCMIPKLTANWAELFVAALAELLGQICACKFSKSSRQTFTPAICQDAVLHMISLAKLYSHEKVIRKHINYMHVSMLRSGGVI